MLLVMEYVNVPRCGRLLVFYGDKSDFLSDKCHRCLFVCVYRWVCVMFYVTVSVSGICKNRYRVCV